MNDSIARALLFLIIIVAVLGLSYLTEVPILESFIIQFVNVAHVFLIHKGFEKLKSHLRKHKVQKANDENPGRSFFLCDIINSSPLTYPDRPTLL